MLQDVEIWGSEKPANFKRKMNPEWLEDIVNLATATREALANHINVTDKNSPNYNYAGLCTTYTDAFMSTFKLQVENNELPSYLKVRGYHGEIKHNWKVPSSEWDSEHTWCSVTDGVNTVWVDGTTAQFRPIFDKTDTLPDYYVSTVEPRWYYPDKRNPAWSSIAAACEPIRMIIRFMQYNIWGPISDLMRLIKLSKI